MEQRPAFYSDICWETGEIFVLLLELQPGELCGHIRPAIGLENRVIRKRLRGV